MKYLGNATMPIAIVLMIFIAMLWHRSTVNAHTDQVRAKVQACNGNTECIVRVK